MQLSLLTSSHNKLTRVSFSLPVAAILLLASLPLMAKELSSTLSIKRQLSLQQAIEKSLLSHPALAGYQYRLMSIDASAKQAAVGEKPEVSLFIEDALGTGQYAMLDRAQSTLSISWVLQGGLLEQRTNAAQSKVDVTKIERDILRYDIAAQTAHAFLTVLGLQEKLVVAKKARQYTVDIRTEIQRRVDAGRTPLADKLQAEVNLQRRELVVEDIQHELKSALKLLASQWGRSQFDDATVNGDITLSRQLANYDELEKRISNNPEVRYFLTQQRVIDSEITLAQEEVKNRW
jgi:cobalt-zinc-cadmium efflux system outer membrane protein